MAKKKSGKLSFTNNGAQISHEIKLTSAKVSDITGDQAVKVVITRKYFQFGNKTQLA